MKPTTPKNEVVKVGRSMGKTKLFLDDEFKEITLIQEYQKQHEKDVKLIKEIRADALADVETMLIKLLPYEWHDIVLAKIKEMKDNHSFSADISGEKSPVSNYKKWRKQNDNLSFLCPVRLRNVYIGLGN